MQVKQIGVLPHFGIDQPFHCYCFQIKPQCFKYILLGLNKISHEVISTAQLVKRLRGGDVDFLHFSSQIDDHSAQNLIGFGGDVLAVGVSIQDRHGQKKSVRPQREVGMHLQNPEHQLFPHQGGDINLPSHVVLSNGGQGGEPGCVQQNILCVIQQGVVRPDKGSLAPLLRGKIGEVRPEDPVAPARANFAHVYYLNLNSIIIKPSTLQNATKYKNYPLGRDDSEVHLSPHLDRKFAVQAQGMNVKAILDIENACQTQSMHVSADRDVRIYVSLHCSEGVLRISSLNNQLLQHILMSLKASIEVAINWSDLRIKDFSRQGYVRYSTSVHYSINPATAIYFMPYSIIPNHLLSDPSHQSQIDHEAKCCYSRLIEVQYFNQHPILENQTCCFKGYVDLRILPKINLFLTVELLFTEDPRTNFSVIYTSTLLIRKFPNVFAFIPLYFDDHEALQLCGTLQSTVMEYRFQSCEEECHSQFPEQWESIEEYFGAVTHQYQYNEVLKFFKSHRRRLQESMIRLEEDHNAVLKLLRQQENSKFMKLMTNRHLEAELEKMYSKETVTLSPENKHRVLELILKDFLAIKVHIYERLNTFNALIHTHSGMITNHLQREYQNRAENRLRNSLSTITFENNNWTFSRFDSSGQKHLEEAPILRNNLSLLEEETKKAFALEDPLYFGNATSSLHIFEEVYQTSQPQREFPPNCEHIVFLVHGFQGSKADLSAMKYYLEAKHALNVHISTANAGRTEESLNVLGVRLAIQVNRIVEKKKNFMMSFIGHSMGGLIILSAMSSLKSVWSKMHSYTSIGTPHLGYLYAPSNMVKVGLWLMNSLQECESITEICMQDNESPKDCFLYRLACSQQLCHFRKVSFIASPQDQYVPYESARVEKNSRLLKQLNQSDQVKVICDMVDGMLGKVTACKITRVSVVFHIEESTLNSFIGRVAHIKFLNDQHFIRHFVITLKHLFL